jgi:hypothetical protein
MSESMDVPVCRRIELTARPDTTSIAPEPSVASSASRRSQNVPESSLPQAWISLPQLEHEPAWYWQVLSASRSSSLQALR